MGTLTTFFMRRRVGDRIGKGTSTMLTDNDLTIQVHPSPETPSPPRSFTTDEVEAKLLLAYNLGYSAAKDQVREPFRLLMELTRQLVDTQTKTIDILKGYNHDTYW